MKLKVVLIGAALVAAVAIVMVQNLGPKEAVQIVVQTEPARMEPITQVVTASGKIRPEVEVKVAADVGGWIRKLTLKAGDPVTRGQLLLEIDPEIYRARVLESQAAEQTARAGLILSEAGLRRAEGEERRVRGLFRKDLTSSAALEKAEADLAIAQAEVEAARGRLLQAQASLERARGDLGKCTIVSPIAGTVTLLNKQQGERASGGDFREDIVMVVADLSAMEVEVEVGERDVVLLELGDQAEIEVDAYPGQKVPGTVTEIAHAGTTRNQWTEAEVTNFRVVVRVGETPLVIRPQMSATVSIQTDHKDEALTVPIQSVTLRRPSELTERPELAQAPGRTASFERGGRPPQNDAPGKAPEEAGSGRPPQNDAQGKAPDAGGGRSRVAREEPVEVVFVVQDGRAMAKRVKTGLASDTRIEILQGLESGAEVISGPFRALSKDLRHQTDVRVGALETRRRGGPEER